MQFITEQLPYLLGLKKVKEPTYTVIDKQDLKTKYSELRTENKQYEIRNYSKFVMASVASNREKKGFMNLAKYIGVLGNAENEQQQRMAMTAPVFVENLNMNKENTDEQMMHFVLPEDISIKDQAPKPNDPNIIIQESQDEFKVAVKRFTMTYNEAKGQKMLDELLNELKIDGIINQSQQLKDLNWRVAIYNDPFTIPFLRRNEVWIQIN